MAIAAYRRTVALTSANASTSGFIAARPMRASARDASRAGDVAQSKISLLSPQRLQPSPSSPHGSDETSVSSPSRPTSEGIAETASVPRAPSSRAAEARSSALADFRPSARDTTTGGVGCAAGRAVPRRRVNLRPALASLFSPTRRMPLPYMDKIDPPSEEFHLHPFPPFHGKQSMREHLLRVIRHRRLLCLLLRVPLEPLPAVQG